MSDYAVSLRELEAAAARVHLHFQATPHYNWPLLSARVGADVWAKHENHTPIGAFKLRGGLLYIDDLISRTPKVAGVVAATRGNHGQSVACAAALRNLSATIVTPRGNSVEKNAAMRAQGAEIVVHGEDFQEALEYARALSQERDLHMVQSLHPLLVRGVATYGWEFMTALPDLEAIYVPIGIGSGICAVIAARDALGLATKVVGVVAENAPAYALSFERGEPVSTNKADTIADGMACRVPDPEAVAVIRAGADRILRVSEQEIRAAMRAWFVDTHNVAEGAGAASLAGLLQERGAMAGKRVGVILSGGNVDRTLFQEVLREGDAEGMDA